MQPTRARRGLIVAVAPVVALSILAACSDDGSDAGAETIPASTTATTVPLPIATSPVGENDTSFPVDVIDCDGRVTTYEQAPQRVVALDEAMAENLIQLGFRDAIVGVARYQTDDALWPLTRDEVLSRQIVNDGSTAPTMDAVERVAPDLVVASGSDTMDAVATRDDWTAAGIHTFVPRTGCDAPTADADGLTMFYDDYTQLGLMFDAQLHSQKIIAQVQAHVDQMAGELARVDAQQATVWVYGGADVVFDRTTPVDSMLRAVGLTVVGGDGAVDADTVAEANPDLIWIITPRGADPDEAAAALEAELAADPALADLRAVTSSSFVVTPADQVSPTPRMTDGLQQVVDALIAMA